MFITDNVDSIEIILSINRELKEVVVTGTSLSKYIDELNARPTEIITSKELLKAACCNLLKVLQPVQVLMFSFRTQLQVQNKYNYLDYQEYTLRCFRKHSNIKRCYKYFSSELCPGPWMTAISISKGAGSVVNGYESITGQINI